MSRTLASRAEGQWQGRELTVASVPTVLIERDVGANEKLSELLNPHRLHYSSNGI